MLVGLHSGVFDFFLVGDSHRELLITGPAATETVSMEGTAVAGEVLASQATAALLPRAVLGKPKGDGVLLRSMPKGLPRETPSERGSLEGVDLLTFIPVALREHLLAGATDPEHRQVTVAFIHFDGIDDLIRQDGPEAVAFGLDELVQVAQAASEKHGVTFLGTDVDKDGGKIILVAGAPSSPGEDEERMLLAARAVIDAQTAIPIRIGINKGPVFSGEMDRVPPYIHGDGRCCEPGRPRDGQGGAGAGTRNRRCARCVADALRSGRTRTLPRQREGEAGPRLVGRSPHREPGA